MKGRDFYYNPSTNEMELKSDPSPLRPDQPTLPDFKNLPVTKPTPNKKPIHQQLLDLKHWAQPETRKELSTGGYIDKEQRIYEALKIPGYETIEKSNVSYKKLKEKEKSTYPFDTAKGIDHVTKTLKEESPEKLNSKESTDLNILNKEMKLSVLKNEIAGVKKFDNFDKTTYPSDPEQKRRLKNISELEKSLGYNSPEINVPYQKDTRSPNTKKKDAFEEKKYNIKQRLKNTRGLSDWELITKTAKTPQEKREVREIVNKNYKRDPGSIAPEDRKWLDKDLVEPVKITEYPEVILGSDTSVSSRTINRNDKPVEQIVKELADERLVHEQRNWDHHYGKGGITSLKRPD